MASGTVAMTRAAAIVAAVLVVLTLGTLAVTLAHARGAALGPADWAALRFTLAQAGLGAVLSVVAAVPVARALFRRRFPGRGAIILLMGAPFLLPVIVAVMALLSVFGRAGLVNDGLAALGLPAVSIYGPQGVVLGLVFFNLPLAVRMLLAGWQAIPAERFRLASALGFGPGQVFRHLEAPMLREVVPGALVAIFLVCLTTFAVALTLGGGPRATTLELAIYQALRFEYDLGRAALLAALQFALCGGVVLLAGRLTLPARFGAGLDLQAIRPDAPTIWLRVVDGLAILGATLFLMVPLAMILRDGLPGIADLPEAVWQAAARSVAVALAATLLGVAAALILAIAIARGPGARWLEVAGMLPLAASSLVLGTGLFLMLRPLAAPETLALPVTILVNAALALPFALRLILPQMRGIETAHGRLADALGLNGLARLRWLILPRLRAQLGFAAGVVAALSMGDLGVIALFAGEGTMTLPLLVQQLMGAYRMDEAAAAALVLLVLSYGLFWLFDRGGRHAGA